MQHLRTVLVVWLVLASVVFANDAADPPKVIESDAYGSSIQTLLGRKPVALGIASFHSSHYRPVVSTLIELAKRGWEVHLAVREPSLPKIGREYGLDKLDFGLHSLGPSKWDTERYVEFGEEFSRLTKSKQNDMQKVGKLMQDFFLDISEEKLPLALEVAGELKPDVLLCDIGLRTVGRIVSETYSLPLVWTSPLREAFFAEGFAIDPNYPVLPYGAPCEMDFAESTGNYFFGLLMEWYLVPKVFFGFLPKLRETYGLPSVTDRREPVLIETVRGFDCPVALSSRNIQVGPIRHYDMIKGSSHLKDDVRAFVDRGRFVVVSFGLTAVLEKEALEIVFADLQAFLAARSGDVRVVWSLPSRQQLMLDLSNRKISDDLMVVSFIAQAAAVAHANCEVLVTQAGTGAVKEALHSGVPIVSIPMIADQFDESQRVAEFGCGLRLAGFEKGTLTAALTQVVNNAEFRLRARQASFLFQHSGGVRVAADVVESIVAVGDRWESFLFPASETVWWRYYRLPQVVVFVTPVVLLFIVLSVLRCCFRLFFGRRTKPKRD